MISMLLFCALIAPVSAQKVRTDHTHKQTASKKADCAVKECKCVCHKKDSKRGSHKKSASKGQDRKRSSRRGRSSRSGRRGTSRRSNVRSHARKGPPTKKAKNTKEMNDVRKKWAEAMKKRVNSSNQKRDGEWRKRIEEMRKTFQLQVRDGRFIAK